MTSKKAFEAYMRKQKINVGDWFVYWPIWQAAVKWQKKNA